MGEHQPGDPVPAGLLGDIQGGHVPAHPASEADRAVPAGRVGEQEAGPGGPLRERPELRRPHRRGPRQAQQVPPGGVAGVGDRVRLDHQVGDGDGGHRRGQPAGGGECAQLAAQLAPLVTHQPGRQPPGRLGAGTAVQHDLAAAVADQQPGRRVAGRVHRSGPEQGQPQPGRYRRHARPAAGRPGVISPLPARSDGGSTCGLPLPSRRRPPPRPA